MEVEENNNEKLKQIGVDVSATEDGKKTYKNYINSSEQQDADITEEQKGILKQITRIPNIVQRWENEIREIDEELKNKKNTKEQISLINRREVLNAMISLIPDIKDPITKQSNRFKKVEERVEDYKKQKIEIDKETEVLIQETEELNKHLTSTLEQLEREVDSKKELRSENVVLLHIEASKKIEQFEENIRILEKKLEEINKSGEEADETTIFGEWAKTPEGKERIAKLSNVINSYADNIVKKNREEVLKNHERGNHGENITKESRGDGGVIGKIKRFYEKSREKTKEFFKKFLGIGNKETNLNPKAEEIERDVEELKDLFKKWQKDPENYTVPFHIKKNELYRRYGGEKINKIIEQMIK